MTIVESVGWVLVHFIWQGVAIALTLAVLLALTPAAQAALRYVFSCTALVMMLVATLVTAANLSRTSTPAVVTPASRALVPLPLPATEDRSLAKTSQQTIAVREMTVDDSVGWRERLTARLSPVVERSVPWLVLLWIGGVSVMALRLAGGWWRTRNLRIHSVSAAPAWAEEKLVVLCAQLRITRAVALVASTSLSVPVVFGHLKPVVIVPAAAFAGLSPSHLEAILAHELAHVRRRDYLVNLVQSVIESLLFYHPAVWWVSHQVRVTREHCCDDLAVGVCGNRRDYIHALLDLEELRGPGAVLALGATDGSLLGRARRLLRPSQPRCDAPRLAASAIVLSIASVVAVLSFLSASRVDASPGAAPLPGPAAILPADAETGETRQATPVVTAPDSGGTLESRWTWAERTARDERRARYWIGYRISPVKGLPRFVYFDRARRILGNDISFSGHTLSDDVTGLRFPGRPLALAGDDTGLKVLFELDGARGTPVLTAVHLSTLSLPVDLKSQPIFWLGAADSSQSLAHIDRLYRRVGTAELKDDLVAAAGVHDASPAVVKWLSARLDSGDPDEVRANAAERIAWHPIRESIDVLDRTARGDRVSRVRQEAAEALGDLALPDAAPALVNLARTLQDEQARLEAVEALGARSEPIAHEALAEIARKDASAEIQREAVETLGDYEDHRGVPLLTELARTHPNIDVRREAIETLADRASDRSDPRERDEILELLSAVAAGDPDADVQVEAVETLGEIDDPKAIDRLHALAQTHADDRVRAEAVETLGDTSSPAGSVPLLKRIALGDRSRDVQNEAIETLSELPDGAGIAALVELAREHPDEGVRKEALEALLESDHPKAREVFDRALGRSSRQ
jgi:beta-lactamase regulating signal transducer with metallopeptidase domain/HEAT repeat protein